MLFFVKNYKFIFNFWLIFFCCRCCDNCENPPSKMDLGKECFMLLSLFKATGQKFGVGMMTDILRGSRNKSVLDKNFQKLEFYNKGKDHEVKFWKELFGILLADSFIVNEYISFNNSKNVPIPKLTDKAKEFLDNSTLESASLTLSITASFENLVKKGEKIKKIKVKKFLKK